MGLRKLIEDGLSDGADIIRAVFNGLAAFRIDPDIAWAFFIFLVLATITWWL